MFYLMLTVDLVGVKILFAHLKLLTCASNTSRENQQMFFIKKSWIH